MDLRWFYIEELLKSRLKDAGASIVGFANLEGISSEERKGYNYGISIAVALNPSVINNLNVGVFQEYEKEYIDINKKLDDLAFLGSELLKKEGFEAVALTTTEVAVDNSSKTLLPHKTVATRAGIGWIGKCALLVTYEYGSAIRLASILTNAELEVCTTINESYCGECSRCVNDCPGRAVKGVNWTIDKERSEYYNHIDCRKEARRRSGINNIELSLCGICILTCPYTQKYIKSNNLEYKGNDIKIV